MKALLDAALPASMEDEAPPEIQFVRWAARDHPDDALVRYAAEHGFTAVVFYGRNALLQSSVTSVAAELGVVVLVVDARDPFEARDYLFRNTRKIRDAVMRGSAVVINASGVHNPSALGIHRALV